VLCRALLLIALGIGGGWVSNLSAMAPYRPVFIGLALLFLGLACRKLYSPPLICTPGPPCADPRTLKRWRLAFWLIAAMSLGLLAVPRLAPLFF